MLLTWNEQRNIAACLRSLGRQSRKDFEIIVVDAASTDATREIVRRVAPGLPMRVRLDVAATKIPIGEARNRGVALAHAPIVAFLSADAELEEHWVETALGRLARCDMVWGRQEHAPRTWTVGAAVRGLRYRFPATGVDDPLPFASNVAAAYKKQILEEFPFDPQTNAAEDLLLARRAHRAGYKALYEPSLVVRHHDVAGFREEWRKNAREGEGWAVYRSELGLFLPLLAWGGLLVATLVLVLLLAQPLILLGTAVLLYLPALRRAAHRARAIPPRALLVGVLASPIFDLAFLACYVAALPRSAESQKKHPSSQPQEKPA